jgi:AcrR family transcriptional regulator
MSSKGPVKKIARRPSRPPGRPRCAETCAAIRRAALDLLEEVGFAALTVEGIAARAGVGKATLYRWWPNKAGVVMDSFLDAYGGCSTFPDTGCVREDLRQQLRLAVLLLTGPKGRAIAALLGGLRTTPELAEAFRTRWLRPRREEARRALARGVERGQVRRDVDYDAAVDALYGPLYFRLLTGHAPLNRAFADALTETVMAGIIH